MSTQRATRLIDAPPTRLRDGKVFEGRAPVLVACSVVPERRWSHLDETQPDGTKIRTTIADGAA